MPSPPPGYVPFVTPGTMPDLTQVSFPPNGTLVNFANLYGDGSDAFIGPIFWALAGVDYLSKNLSAAVLALANTWSGAQTFTKAIVGGVGAVADAADQTIDGSKFVWQCANPGAQREVYAVTSPAPVNGQILIIRRSATGAHDIVVHNGPAEAAAIVTLASSTCCGAILQFKASASKWILLIAGDGSTAGADAG